MKTNFLVETALLAHGLPSASDSDILSVLGNTVALFSWIDKGKIKTGIINQFLSIRDRSASLIRINHTLLETAQTQELSGVLTASGTMAVCQKLGIPLAVTCGMGGIGMRDNEKVCNDADALAITNTALIATSPKDMFDIKETLKQLKEKGISVYGNNTDKCTGYVFSVANEPIIPITDKTLPSHLIKGRTLILNPIPQKLRIADIAILERSILKGIEAEKEGKYYHPEVNREIDLLTTGYSTKIQLLSLANNILLAKQLTSK